MGSLVVSFKASLKGPKDPNWRFDPKPSMTDQEQNQWIARGAAKHKGLYMSRSASVSNRLS